MFRFLEHYSYLSVQIGQLYLTMLFNGIIYIDHLKEILFYLYTLDFIVRLKNINVVLYCAQLTNISF